MARPRIRSLPVLALPQLPVNVRAARNAAGLTQEQLARAMDVSLRTVQGWELGEVQHLGAPNLLALAKALGKDPGWFYGVHNDDPGGRVTRSTNLRGGGHSPLAPPAPQRRSDLAPAPRR
jgi:transcriptional regulator with XRE-family HTH domain